MAQNSGMDASHYFWQSSQKNFSRYRLVIIDNLKTALEMGHADKFLGDIVKARQLIYSGVNSSFVTLDNHDLIGTHFLIYDTSDFLEPKLVAGYRLCYEDRAHLHHTTLPFPFKTLPEDICKKVEDFAKDCGSLVNGSLLYVNPEYTFSKKKLPFIEVLFWQSFLFIYRLGYDNFFGMCNEKFRISRWFENAGSFPKDIHCIHPITGHDHMLLLIKDFNLHWLRDGFYKFAGLLETITEIIGPSPTGRYPLTLEDVFKKLDFDSQTYGAEEVSL